MKLETAEPACTEKGRDIYTCSFCGDRYEEEGEEAAGHNFSAEVTREAVCGQQGIETFVCGQCGETYTEDIPMLVHNYGEWQTEREAGPGTAGSAYQECAYCLERIYREIPALIQMDVDFISVIAIGVGILLLVVGFAVKRITKRKVEELEGFVGIIDKKDQREDLRK